MQAYETVIMFGPSLDLDVFIICPCAKSHWVFIQSTSNIGTKILRYWGLLVWLFQRISSCSSGFIRDFLDHYVNRCRFNDVHVGWFSIHCLHENENRAPYVRQRSPFRLHMEIHLSNYVSIRASVEDGGTKLTNVGWLLYTLVTF